MKPERIRTAWSLVAASLLLGATGAAALEIKLPEDTARLTESSLPGYTLATTYCYTCHSVDYVRIQPPANTRATWRAAVVKMQKTFGAPIPDEAIDAVAEYLAKTYGAERAPANGAASASPSAVGDGAKPPGPPRTSGR